jgi:ABC-type glycerol-3-phosphate transport system substrate-binding protein
MMTRLLLVLLVCLAPVVGWADEDVSAPTAACPQGVLTLHMLKPQNNPPYQAQLDLFYAANPCITVDIAEVPFGQLADKISVLAASGKPPDVLTYDGPNTQSYAAAGMLLALDPYLPAGFKDDVVAPSLEEHSWEGKLYSPGTQQTTLALFYNKDALDKAGIAYPPPELDKAWTWAQAIEAFKKCQQGDADNVTVWGLAPTHFGNGTPGFVYRDMLFLRTQGDPKAPPDSSVAGRQDGAGLAEHAGGCRRGGAVPGAVQRGEGDAEGRHSERVPGRAGVFQPGHLLFHYGSNERSSGLQMGRRAAAV